MWLEGTSELRLTLYTDGKIKAYQGALTPLVVMEPQSDPEERVSGAMNDVKWSSSQCDLWSVDLW